MESVRDLLRCITEEIEDRRFLSFKGDGEVDGAGVRERRKSAKTEEGEGEEEGEEEDINMEGVEDGEGDSDGDGKGRKVDRKKVGVGPSIRSGPRHAPLNVDEEE